jgi:protocatechuate 3,4-dioxygenase beta subunit
MNRRALLKRLTTVGGAVALSSLAKGAELCAVNTPKQPKGPFYPIKDQIDKDADLTVIDGSNQQAIGRVVYVSGVVQDEKCQPVEEAFVEIWQACASGKYNHPADPNNAKLDPNFQYWGIVKTNSKGEYLFKTIYPGAYPADRTWIRPPHIHFKVSKWGYRELITQLYFEGEDLNEKDLILQSLSHDEHPSVVRPVKVVKGDNGQKIEIVDFPITLLR